jgi:glycosyltransferase involved in cell wall biosynthesis
MRIAILGTVGVPCRYGGFETLAENLVLYGQKYSVNDHVITVYCSSQAYEEQAEKFHGAYLRYLNLNANGVQSVPYDILSALDAVLRRNDTLLFLGVSGAIIIPFLRIFTKVKIVINVDGIEWKRKKWRGLARLFLRWSEFIAVKFSHEVIADNAGIADYLLRRYGRNAEIIAYGGDHACPGDLNFIESLELPEDYALALCRIEPENNVHIILEAFEKSSVNLVFVGNWQNSDYGKNLLSRYKDVPNLLLLDPIYDTGKLMQVRHRAMLYVHGHSAGGTNPSLVETMHFGLPVFAFDCVFNRYTTEEKALYFGSVVELTALLRTLSPKVLHPVSVSMKEIAMRRYTWEAIGVAYFRLLER